MAYCLRFIYNVRNPKGKKWQFNGWWNRRSPIAIH